MAITKKTDAKGSAFWQPAENARIKVEGWPTWKQNLKVTQCSVESGSRSPDSSKASPKTVCKREG